MNEGLGIFVTRSYDKKGPRKMASKKPAPLGRIKGTGKKPMREPEAQAKARRARQATSGTVTSAKAAGKALGPAAPGTLAQIKKNNQKAAAAKIAARGAQRRGMAATRAEAPTRRKVARDAFYRDQDAKMAANKKKWSAANKKGMN